MIKLQAEMQGMPPPYSTGPSAGGGGYGMGPGQYAPYPAFPPPMTGYAPAPPVLQQQSSNTVSTKKLADVHY